MITEQVVQHCEKVKGSVHLNYKTLLTILFVVLKANTNDSKRSGHNEVCGCFVYQRNQDIVS